MTLHEAIKLVLLICERPLLPKDIARKVNVANLYQRGDGTPVPSSQIGARVNNYPKLFLKKESKIYLKNTRYETTQNSNTTKEFRSMDIIRRVEPKATWKDLALPRNTLSQLKDISEYSKDRQWISDEYKFVKKHSIGVSLSVLFSGPSGSDKTMAAEVLATDLGMPLYRIDLAGVISKYIGETEKNLNKIFDSAETSKAILFFDEADSLFGKRTEVKDSHDRYANIEIQYLLQRMEEYEGISILATNLRQNIDSAFIRCLLFVIEFPEKKLLSRIWEWLRNILGKS